MYEPTGKSAHQLPDRADAPLHPPHLPGRQLLRELEMDEVTYRPRTRLRFSDDPPTCLW
ncbi:MAG: hypothetical protein R3E93_01030 [Thiothrix sp.]